MQEVIQDAATYTTRESLTGKIAELVFDYLCLNLEERRNFYERLDHYTRQVNQDKNEQPYSDRAGGAERTALQRLVRRVQYEHSLEYRGAAVSVLHAEKMLLAFARLINPTDELYYKKAGRYDYKSHKTQVCAVCNDNKTWKYIFIPAAELPAHIKRQYGETVYCCPNCKRRFENEPEFAYAFKLQYEAVLERDQPVLAGE